MTSKYNLIVMLSALHSEVIRAIDLEALHNLAGVLRGLTRTNTSDEVARYAERIDRLIKLRHAGITRLYIRRSGVAGAAVRGWNELILN